MSVAMTSRTLDAYAKDEQRDRLSDPVKWLWLEFNTVFKHVSLAHQYLNYYTFKQSVSQKASQSMSQSVSQSTSQSGSQSVPKFEL